MTNFGTGSADIGQIWRADGVPDAGAGTRTDAGANTGADAGANTAADDGADACAHTSAACPLRQLLERPAGADDLYIVRLRLTHALRTLPAFVGPLRKHRRQSQRMGNE